ncbi:hypothetical protein OHA84_35125 [Streptomyces sp. NBC_00513]|uniref:hypothetical protein n=1 Tax=unclassified Streptomyces TaxID=2593676 RepID=UPI00225B97E6|nr:hypothetical protein [Streptomyces sp. NBC_00424]MCX5071247.1 hypothetical protein [Streptomyces sp. NBC_00424]WUD45336.1 hypothetical protein OHA84_35125 [Streptomyces sp. NBC_00513]
MAAHFVEPIPARLLMWQRVRDYAVPPSMIENATARRAAGDWAGACAVARIDVDLDLRAVRDSHGTDLATRIRADLRRLAPELLRWNMPRIAPDGRLRPGLTLSLARYGARGPAAPQLVVRTPPAWADAGQRMSLALWEDSRDSAPEHHPHPHPDRRFRLDLHRHLWDATRSAELAQRCGADAPYRTASRDPSWPPGHWAHEAELLLRAEGRPRGALTVRLGARSHSVLELVAPDDSHAPVLRPVRETLPPQQIAALPLLPEAAARRHPDLELLRAGLLPAERLHPLVAAALSTLPVAVGSASGPAAEPGPGRPADDPAPRATDPHRVECLGEVHRIALRNGTLTAVDHPPTQLAREELLMALGGPGLPCLRAIDTVHRSPEALPAVRERLGHGDVTGALAVVEGLLGPGAVLREGPLREALEAAVAGRLGHGLFRSGLVPVHPAAAATGDPGYRPRLDRRLPQELRRKRGSRTRPRTGL